MNMNKSENGRGQLCTTKTVPSQRYREFNKEKGGPQKKGKSREHKALE